MKSLIKNKIIFLSALFSAAIFLSGVLFPKTLIGNLNSINSAILTIFSNYYLVVGLLVVIISIVILFLPIAKRKLGNIKPEYSYFSWIALLYSTGMGSGLLLRAVQEPVYYLQNPPVSTDNPRVLSMQYTFFHWGFTPWAMYSLFGLTVAYNLYNQKAKNILQAIVPWQNSVLKFSTTLFIILITITGVIASMGLGTAQFVGGINQYFNLHLGTGFLVCAVFIIGVVATLSALTGIHKIIKYLADFDLTVSILLMVFIGSFLNFSDYSFNLFSALGNYITHFFEMSLSTGTYKTSDSFTKEWTVFYWAFWLAWVPFTGIFIARISKGRSVREFIVATILVPTLATIVWFSVFANNAFEIVSVGDPSQFDNVFTSLFVFLTHYPLSHVTVFVGAILVLVAIINSVDSAIFVLAMCSDHGSEYPTRNHKLIWGVIITSTAIGLATLGTSDILNAISNLLIIMALPFSVFYLCQIGYFITKIFKYK
jgi:glycine betaine transporter